MQATALPLSVNIQPAHPLVKSKCVSE